MVIRNFGGWKDIFWEKVTWKSVTCKKNQITSKFKRQDPFLERIKNKNCPGFWRPGNGHPMLYTLYNIQCILNYRLFCSKGLLDMSDSINLLVDLRLQRSSSFVEFYKFSLALTQVFDDFSIWSDISCWYFDHRSVCVFKWYSSFVEFHISVSSDRRNSIKISLLQISRHFWPFSFKSTLKWAIRIHVQGNKDDVIMNSTGTTIAGWRLYQKTSPHTGQGRHNLASIYKWSGLFWVRIGR